MSQDEQKRRAAEAALAFVDDDMTIGVGTGSTVNHFIDALADRRIHVRAAVASSEATAERLRAHNIPVQELNDAGDLPIYIDGADEFTEQFQLIKGGGGALTREKILAAASEHFVCIADTSKRVRMLGKFPLPVEVIPMARSFVGRRIARLGGEPRLRTGVTTDNGNVILDVHGLEIMEPIKLERSLNDIPGVVCNGLFAMRGADVLLIAGEDGVERLEKSAH
jgi:ribose 5-phosphate isomerase A